MDDAAQESSRGRALALSAPLLAKGARFALVVGPMDHDDPCLDWVGAMVCLEGPSRGFPSLEEAYRDGLFHQGCRHGLAPADPAGMSPVRRAQAAAATEHARRAMAARQRGEAPPAHPARVHSHELRQAQDGLIAEHSEAYRVNCLRKFERVYQSARQALGAGQSRVALQKCQAALTLLEDEKGVLGGVQPGLEARLRQQVARLRAGQGVTDLHDRA